MIKIITTTTTKTPFIYYNPLCLACVAWTTLCLHRFPWVACHAATTQTTLYQARRVRRRGPVPRMRTPKPTRIRGFQSGCFLKFSAQTGITAKTPTAAAKNTGVMV